MPEEFDPTPDNAQPVPTRARRLMNAARAETSARRADAVVGALHAAKNVAANASGTVESKSAPRKTASQDASTSARSGARARDLNRRIREAVREQTDAVYAAPQAVPQAASSASEEIAHSSRAAQPNFDASSSRDASSARMSTHAAAQMTNEGGALDDKIRASKATSSWEDIANEVAPDGVSTRRGLATGAMRGPSRRDPNSARSPSPDARYLPIPDAPRVIEAPLFSEGAHFDDVAGGSEQNCDAYGTHYLVSRAADSYDAVFGGLGARLETLLQSEVFPALSGAQVEDLLFVDIETTGLSSASPLFLVGALHLKDARSTPQLDLFLARDYPEEGALLAAFHDLARGRSLVTFNGKSFDWPYIEGRSRAHRLRFDSPSRHFDLLHHARRTWKHRLPNCKLQTLELHLCNRTRLDDVPGHQIPRVYHEFARRYAMGEGGAHLMAPVLHHNALDILTMAEILCLAGEELQSA